ncbi:DNA mismatch repair protein MutS domain protein [Granulicella mallensis MP5ACTX8]|uniref:Endonuclease MutS2 n=1 Tax=Granulicella mallensis (strain ATCC BAA-1857 / DSM 23137 / MP5ACTX8) TaxID=682795 RepID=G8NZJ6_GRAMM|nr:DNA mismatch repair protein MutS domain protein [Granulicella mallensis MP5ACTX8]
MIYAIHAVSVPQITASALGNLYPREVELLPQTPNPLSEIGAKALQWADLQLQLAERAQSSLGRACVLTLQPSADLAWIERQQQRTEEMRRLVAGGGGFQFRGIFDPSVTLDKARIEGSALEPVELLAALELAERVEAWRQVLLAPPGAVQGKWPAIEELSAPLLTHDLGNLLTFLRGKIEADGSLSDDASPELRRIRRAMERQHRAIEDSLRRALSKLSESGSTQDELITVRGERFVIPVKAEFKRKVGGVVHGSSSSGQTVFVEPMETIEQNNELVRLLDEEQAEVHRILVAMTRAVAAQAQALLLGAGVLAQADAHQAVARFAELLECVRPAFASAEDVNAEDDGYEFELAAARHPLLELRLREQDAAIVPLTIALPLGMRQMIVSGPNTGGKTVALKTAGLLALMAQAGLPVPAARAKLPLFTAIYADIGDAQSIEQNLSTFSAHVVNVNRIARVADDTSLVLLDELGSATDPEEGAALAVAVAEHFLMQRAWCLITTHLTSLKVYATKHEGVLNAAVGFDEARLAPTYELRLGVPGASAGLNIAARLGLDPAIVANARAQMTTQQIDIGRFLDELHAQLAAAKDEREGLAELQKKLNAERLKLATEGRAEQQARTRELERQLKSLIEDFESQLRDTVKAIDDKTVAQKIARDSALRIAQLRREFSAQFQSTVATHTSENDPASQKKTADRQREPGVGDLVRLKSLGREGRVARVIDAKTLEVTVGAMKMRVPRTDVAEVVAVAKETPVQGARRRGGVTVSTSTGSDDAEYMTSEINVIGRTADEAESEVERFVERAFLAGLPSIRVVHGVGMGILRRTLRTFLKNHPHVVSVTEPPYNEGGQGATLVELRQ